MFENIQLFAKPGNNISEPNETWGPKTKIYCSCELNTGFGEKCSFAIPLIELISFYKELSLSVTNPGFINSEHSFKHSHYTIVISWNRTASTETTFIVRRKGFGKDVVILQKALWSGYVYGYGEVFYRTVMRILTTSVPNEVCTYFGELMSGGKGDAAFKIGQKVSTVIGGDVKTLRSGYVISRFYHSNKKSDLYKLMVDGKVYEKWYWPEGLESF